MLIWTRSKEKIEGATNSTFQILISKEKNQVSIKRYRPISLCNSSYKILSKIILNRIKKVIRHLISENQGGFIARRNIYDNILLLQEVIHSSHNHKEAGMAIKLDVASAFDRIRHSYIFRVMERYGFPSNFIRWIKYFISSPWIAHLVNGRPTSFFQAQRGPLFHLNFETSHLIHQ